MDYLMLRMNTKLPHNAELFRQQKNPPNGCGERFVCYFMV
jgi:hypothetical protein